MNEHSDNLVKLIHDAAGQVEPLDGIDGDRMARRAIRHERVRRGAIGGVMALAVAALVTVGGLVAGGKQVLPGAWFSGDVPDGWTEVSAAGLTLGVPPDFEPYEAMGDVSAWGIDPEDEGDWGMIAASSVMVLPAADDEPLPEEYGRPVEVDVQGAASAEYAWQKGGESGEFVGELHVGLESGRTVRVFVLLTDAPEPERTFEQLVDTVRVDRSFDESDLPVYEDERQTLDVILDLPADWQVQEHQGLRFGVPGDWVEDDVSAARDDRWADLSMNDAAGEFRMQVSAVPIPQEPDEDFGYSTDIVEPPPGADRMGVEMDAQEDELRASIEVRREGGRAYYIDLRLPPGEDSDRVVRTIAGNLEFTTEADEVPSYEDLEDARTLVDDAPGVPENWVTVDGQGFSLRVPPDWAAPDDTEDDEIVLDSPAGDEPGESLNASVVEAGVTGYGAIPIGGYRLDVPGAEQTVIRMGDYTAYGEGELFSAFVEATLADGSHLTLGYDGPGAESEERFWQILGTLEVVTP
jgi:hypothetical protein